MTRPAAVNAADAARQLQLKDESYIWTLLKKTCDLTGTMELESPPAQELPRGDRRVQGRLITQESIDRFIRNHYRSTGGKWLPRSDQQSPPSTRPADSMRTLNARLRIALDELRTERAAFNRELRDKVMEHDATRRELLRVREALADEQAKAELLAADLRTESAGHATEYATRVDLQGILDDEGLFDSKS